MDDLTGIRLRHAVLIRGARKAALIGNVTEDFQRLDLHSIRVVDPRRRKSVAIMLRMMKPSAG